MPASFKAAAFALSLPIAFSGSATFSFLPFSHLLVLPVDDSTAARVLPVVAAETDVAKAETDNIM